MKSSLANAKGHTPRRRLQIALQEDFSYGILTAVIAGEKAGDPEARSLADEFRRLDTDEQRRGTLGPWTGGITPAGDRTHRPRPE